MVLLTRPLHRLRHSSLWRHVTSVFVSPPNVLFNISVLCGSSTSAHGDVPSIQKYTSRTKQRFPQSAPCVCHVTARGAWGTDSTLTGVGVVQEVCAAPWIKQAGV